MNLWQPSDYQSDEWQAVRRGAAARSGGLCQFCGAAKGSEGHHWTYNVTPETVTANHVTWLCNICHDLATEFRRTIFYGGWDRFKLLRAFKTMVAQEFDPSMVTQHEQCAAPVKQARLPERPAERTDYDAPRSPVAKHSLPEAPPPRMDF